MELPKIITVVGTNASGKSSIGIELTKIFNGEIISADSRQIYRGFDLCSGKVTSDERRIAQHHLIDIKDIGEPFSAFAFQEMAYHIISQILKRDKVPFIVGGTGQYVESVVYGYTSPGKSDDMELRNKLDKLPLDELQSMIPPKAKNSFNQSDFQNRRRLIPAIMKIACGESLDHKNVVRYNSLQLGVTWTKEVLHKLIDERLSSRIRDGMIDEVKMYLDNGGNQEYLYNLGLEYRYILWYLTGKYQSPDEFKLEMSRAIKRFAKRQMTWFKRDKSIQWLDMNKNYLGQASSLISDFLG